MHVSLHAHERSVLSSALRMSDILECSVSCVEDLFKLREPQQLPAIYFIQPTPASVTRLLEDYANEAEAPYPVVHVFFTSKVRQRVSLGGACGSAHLRYACVYAPSGLGACFTGAAATLALTAHPLCVRAQR